MHGVTPKVIITDQDAQIGDAIKIVFSKLSAPLLFLAYEETHCRATNSPNEQVWR